MTDPLRAALERIANGIWNQDKSWEDSLSVRDYARQVLRETAPAQALDREEK